MNIKKLNSLIDGKKITKASVVRQTGISRPTLDSILEGNDFKVSNLEKICQALCVRVGYFFDEDITIESNQAGRDLSKRDIVHQGTEYNGTSVTEADLRAQIEQLKSQLKDKDDIIALLRDRT